MAFKLTKNRYFYNLSFYNFEQNKISEKREEERVRNIEKEKSAIAKTKIIDYGLNNNFNWFVTITTDNTKVDRDNADLVKNKIVRFLNNYKLRYDHALKYLIVPEYHKNGIVHFHALFYLSDMNFLTYLFYDSKKKNRVYRHDWFYKNLGANRFIPITKQSPFSVYYMVKYISKSMDFPFKHRYFCSKGLKTSTILVSDLNVTYRQKYIQKLLLKNGLIPDFENQFVRKYKFSEEEFKLLFGKIYSKKYYRCKYIIDNLPDDKSDDGYNPFCVPKWEQETIFTSQNLYCKKAVLYSMA